MFLIINNFENAISPFDYFIVCIKKLLTDLLVLSHVIMFTGFGHQ